MKLLLYWSVVLVLVALQVTIGKSFGIVFALPLVLVALVVLSTKLGLEQLLYMALVAGILLDGASGRDFGMQLALLLFTVTFCKLVIRTNEEAGLASCIGISILFFLILSFVQFTRIFGIGEGFSIIEYVSQTLLGVGYIAVWTAILYMLVGRIDKLKFKRLSLGNSGYTVRGK